jgi:hypothetical protein
LDADLNSDTDAHTHCNRVDDTKPNGDLYAFAKQDGDSACAQRNDATMAACANQYVNLFHPHEYEDTSSAHRYADKHAKAAYVQFHICACHTHTHHHAGYEYAHQDMDARAANGYQDFAQFHTHRVANRYCNPSHESCLRGRPAEPCMRSHCVVL